MKQVVFFICFAGLCGNGWSQVVRSGSVDTARGHAASKKMDTVPERSAKSKIDTVPVNAAKNKMDTVPANSPDTIIGPSRLRDTSLLQAVTVHGRKTLVKPTLDGFMYDAESDLAIAAGSAIDVLRRIPLVTIGMDGAPRIQGSNNVRVFIDNKPSEVYASSIADALRLIPAEDIASVEVITQPSARFDAEGTDAVINIITKKNRHNGMNGRLNALLGNSTQQGGASVKWRKGKLIYSVEGNYYRYPGRGVRTNLHRTTHDGSRLQQQKDNKSIWNTYVASAMVTWLVDSQHTLTAGYRFRDVSERLHSVANAIFENDNSVSALTRQLNSHFANRMHSMHAGYTSVSADKKRELNLQAVYFFYKDGTRYHLEQLQHGKVNHIEKSNNKNFNGELSWQADYVQSWGNAFKFEAGVKAFWRQSRADNRIDLFDFAQDGYLFDPIRSNHFNYDRSIYAGYVSGVYTLKSWTVRIGMRYEQTHLHTRFKDTALRIPDYNNWVPNFLISKMLGKNHTLKLSYAKKIIRPYFGSLNPTINYIDSFNIEYGNPALLPISIHNWQLVYQFNKNKLLVSASLFTDYRDNSIEQVRQVKGGVSEITFSNIGKHLTYGVNANLSFDDNRHMSGGAGVVIKYSVLKSPALQLSNNGWMVQPNGRLSYRFNKSLQAESVITYYPYSIHLQGKGGNWFSYSLIVSKKWWKDKLQASWNMENFFTRYQKSTEVFASDMFYQTITNRYPVVFLKLGLTYKFGKKEIREPVQRSGEVEE